MSNNHFVAIAIAILDSIREKHRSMRVSPRGDKHAHEHIHTHTRTQNNYGYV